MSTTVEPACVELQPHSLDVGSRQNLSSPAADLLAIANTLAVGIPTILKTVCAALLIGIVLAVLLPVRYRATATILTPQEPRSAVALMLTQMSNVGFTSGTALSSKDLGLRNPNDTYIALLRSRPIADSLVAKYGLEQSYGVSTAGEAREILDSRTDVKSSKEGLIVVSVNDRNKDRAADLANAYISELRALTKRIATTEAGQRRLYYEQQLVRAQERLLQVEQELSVQQQSSGVYQPDLQIKAVMEASAEVEKRLVERQTALAALLSRATPQNPEVKTIRLEIANLEDKRRRLTLSSATTAPNLANSMASLSDRSSRYLNKAREVSSAQAIVDTLAKQLEAARLDESRDGAVVQVVEEAIPPERKDSPRRTFIVLLALFLGALTGIAKILLRSYVKRHFSNSDLEMLLHSFRSGVKAMPRVVKRS